MNDLLRFPASARTALADGRAVFSYADLERRVRQAAHGLLRGAADLHEERIALLLPAGIDYVSTLLGTWRAGGIAVPLNGSAALPEFEHALATARVTRLVAAREYHDKLAGLCRKLAIEH
jgi:malonyl-CoA/methylmalonyl-CoA synthetase